MVWQAVTKNKYQIVKYAFSQNKHLVHLKHQIVLQFKRCEPFYLTFPPFFPECY